MPFGRLRQCAGACVLTVLSFGCGTPGTAGKATTGGSIVLGAEQYPTCLNPVQECANASWLEYVVLVQVLPRAMAITPQGTFEATPLLDEAPSLANGEIKMDPFSVTYKIDSGAVWDDGTPITAEDFHFTWQAHMKTTGSLFTNGYDKITTIDTTVPKMAVVHFKQPFADWPDLFGGSDHLLKKTAFPSGPNVAKEMTTNIPFSGGPWKLQSFSKSKLVLVPNTRYWGPKPHLSRVTIIPLENTTLELTSLLKGETAAIYPQPTVEMRRRLRSSSKVNFVVGPGTTYEGLWLNLGKPPLNDRAVREALFWATDRQAVVDAIIKPIEPDAQVLNCAGWLPTVGQWCDNTQFAGFHYDAGKARQILGADGWRLGADGIYVKAGQRLSLVFVTTTGNKGRTDTQALLKTKWKAAGIELVVKNYGAPSPIFDDILPNGKFSVSEYAQVASPDPSVTALYACDQIPSAANGYSGQNTSFWCNNEASNLAHQIDRTVDPNQRLALVRSVGAIVRRDLVWLPLYQQPLITAWRTDKVAGPVGRYNVTAYGPFFNLGEWYAP